MKIRTLFAAAVAALGAPALAAAQDGAAAATTTTPPPAVSAAPSPSAIRIPEGTIVELETVDTLSSKVNKRGDKFAIRLIGPLVIDGVEVIPAGTLGVGEVTTVAPAGFGGKAGEMMVLARYLTVDGVQVPLRGFKLGSRGRDNAAIAMFIPYGVGIFMTGGNVEIPAGTDAQAKVAQETLLPPTGAAAAPTVPAAAAATQPTPAPAQPAS